MPSPETELKRLLSEPLSAVIDRERSTFDRLTAPLTRSLVLFGAGGLGRKTLAGLRQVGIEPLAFADNNSALWGKKVNDLLVLSPADAAQRYGRKASFVIAIWRAGAIDLMAERIRQLTNLGCASVISFGPLFWKYPDIFLPHYALDLPHKATLQAENIRRAFSLWADDASRYEYLAQVRWRILLDFDGLPSPVTHEIYFPTDIAVRRMDETFVDCGAFDGDTIKSFLRMHETSFERIFAFEPDASNFRKLRDYISTLAAAVKARVILYPMGVGARGERVLFNAAGNESSSVGSGTSYIDSIALDEALAGAHPTFIKMDIEGSEPEALEGSRGLIARNLPMLTISVYHRQDHLWSIPLAIRALSNHYRFFLRPHNLEVWDLVCYAVPENRLR
jgi:FkbM family methyltransferase